MTKFKTKVLNLSLNLDLSPFVKSAPALKGEKIRLAKQNATNKKFLHQNQPLFGFIPIYGLKALHNENNSNTVCKDILLLH